MTRTDQIRSDADEVLTSAPPLESIPESADLEKTWTGGDDREGLDPQSERIAALERLLENAQHRERVHAEGHRGALEALAGAKARSAELEAQLSAERERAAAAAAEVQLYQRCLETLGLVRDGRAPEGFDVFAECCAKAKATGVSPDPVVGYFAGVCDVPFDLFGLIARITRRSHEIRSAIPASTVPVARDDAGDHTTQDLAK